MISHMTALAAALICSGQAPTHPRTNIEIEIHPHDQISTIRYEVAEGSLTGTAYTQFLGYMRRFARGSEVTYRSSTGPKAAVLKLRMEDGQIRAAWLTHDTSHLDEAPVECRFEETP